MIGKSGCGKSVTMKLITGILSPDKGQVLIDGEDVSGFRQRDWNRVLRQVGVVFQGAALFDSLSVLENVGIRLFEEKKLERAEIERMAAESLSQVGLNPSEVLRKFPSELSGGMQKRVGIARAIIHEPKYVFYDEPTTGLDPVNSSLIDELIDSLSKTSDRTSIVITHDMYTVKTIATKVAFLHNKRLHFFGTPAEMFDSDDVEIQKFLARSI
ncbi:MAG: ATP-binding cassette domain-containing protein [Bacteroidota bacterium]